MARELLVVLTEFLSVNLDIGLLRAVTVCPFPMWLVWPEVVGTICGAVGGAVRN